VIHLWVTVHAHHRAIHALALVTQQMRAYHYAMRNTGTIIILSMVATVLVFGIGACITIGAPPRFRIGDPIRFLPEWGLMDAGETPKI
jgi:hypothetical protein